MTNTEAWIHKVADAASEHHWPTAFAVSSRAEIAFSWAMRLSQIRLVDTTIDHSVSTTWQDCMGHTDIAGLWIRISRDNHFH